MNKIAEEMASYKGSKDWSEENFNEHLRHFGVGHDQGGHSGRYPWGSGEDPYQHSLDFLGRVDDLKKNGWTATAKNIEKEFGLSFAEYRREVSLCNDARKAGQIARANNLKEKYNGNTSAIARAMNVSEATVRGWFKQEEDAKYRKTKETIDYLKEQVDKKGMVDVGKNVDAELGVSRDKLETALYALESSGYHVYTGGIKQPNNPGKQTTQRVLTTPEHQKKDIYNYDEVKTLTDYKSSDDGKTFHPKFTYPESLSSKRLKVRYGDEGGVDKDGIIELRRGVADLDLQGSRYAQVRILVDGTHYLKGMAVYGDNMPDGVDVIFNTNKTKAKYPDKMDTLKKIKNDPDNPFGSAIKDADQGGQYWYTDKNGKQKLGLINKRADEGDWTDWKDALPSQFLAKQSKVLVEKQLNLAKATKQAQYEEIMSLTNPTLKKYYLNDFANTCDKAAVDLKAAALPGQKYHVVIPCNTLKDTEVYAPQYKDGTKLALIRYPHGGLFEIPILTVNNKNSLGKKIIGSTSIDAVGITSKVASQLSGADFDGDTVMCIPTHDSKNRVKILNKDPLPELQGFDTKLGYQAEKVYKDKNGKEYGVIGDRKFKLMTKQQKQTEMGKISNLITDMTLAGASDDKLARAVKHSMVVIDSEKHHLDYISSYKENNIAELEKEFQPKYNKNGDLIGYGGASTIISRAKGDKNINKRQGQAKINLKGEKWYDSSKPEGSLIYQDASPSKLYYVDSKYDKESKIRTIKTKDGKTIEYNMDSAKDRNKYSPVLTQDKKTGEYYYTSKDGKLIYRTKKRTIKSTKMAETDDAFDLVSKKKHAVEVLYAQYANDMKNLANQARIEYSKTKNLEYSPEAKKKYSAEVESLDSKYNEARKNSIKEREVLRKANVEIRSKLDSNSDLDSEDIRKISTRSMSKYREELGSVSRKNRYINITDNEWEAIQKGAISNQRLLDILRNTDPDDLMERAMPKNSKNTVSQAQISRMKAMANSNFTIRQIAEKLGLSTSTVSKYLKGE